MIKNMQYFFDFELLVNDEKQSLNFSDKLNDIPFNEFNKVSLIDAVIEHLRSTQIWKIDEQHNFSMASIEVNTGDVLIDFGLLKWHEDKTITLKDEFDSDEDLARIKVKLHVLIRHDKPFEGFNKVLQEDGIKYFGRHDLTPSTFYSDLNAFKNYLQFSYAGISDSSKDLCEHIKDCIEKVDSIITCVEELWSDELLEAGYDL